MEPQKELKDKLQQIDANVYSVAPPSKKPSFKKPPKIPDEESEIASVMGDLEDI